MFDETLKTSGFYHQIAMFLRSSANDEDIRSGVNRRSAVANARLIGIESCKNALKYQRKMASGQILLASLGRNLQFFWGGAVSKVVQQGVLFNGRASHRQIRVPHIRNGIRGANETKLEAKVSLEYFDLLEEAIVYAADNEIDTLTRCEALQLFGIEFMPEDIIQLQGRKSANLVTESLIKPNNFNLASVPSIRLICCFLTCRFTASFGIKTTASNFINNFVPTSCIIFASFKNSARFFPIVPFSEACSKCFFNASVFFSNSETSGASFANIC